LPAGAPFANKSGEGRQHLAMHGTDDSGGGTLLGSFRSSGRCSLTWAALSFVTICLDKSGERLSGRAAGGPCASNRASPLEPRIAPSSAQRPRERAQHASESNPLASLSHVCRSHLVFIVHRRRFSRCGPAVWRRMSRRKTAPGRGELAGYVLKARRAARSA
jgi:hypothetical protein